MVPEAPLERTDAGLVPAGEDWFVVNARAARWFENPDFGASTVFEGEEAAQAHDGKTAYAQSARHVETPYREGWLPKV